MNKNLSMVIEKAVEKISPNDSFPLYPNNLNKGEK